jgi:predicted patatin/cPLA2 family phospholipase
MRDHPVLELLRERRAGGGRDDGSVLALVLEGGGMRGVVSSAMAEALQRAGCTDCFDLVVGTSAGALNGVAFIAGVSHGSVASYCDADVVRRYIAPRRLLLGRPAVDVAFVLQYADDVLDAERHQRALDSPVDFHCVAVDVETAAPEDLTGMRTVDELHDALLATSRLPWIGGDAVPFRGRRYLDGGLAEAVPVATALAAGATHALVLQTRPEGVPRAHESALVERILERRLRRLNPALVDLHRSRVDRYEQLVADLARWSREPSSAPDGAAVFGVRLPAGTPVVSQLERDPALLSAAAAAARRHLTSVIDLEEVRS